MISVFRLTVALLVGLALSTAPASAATSTFRAQTTDMTIQSLSFDPAVVAANCPAGFAENGGAFLTEQETVQVESAVFSGTLSSVSDQHCSVPRPPMSTWADGSRSTTPIDLEAGHMVLADSSGAELFIDYRAPGVIKGDLFGANTHTFHGSYTVTGGTGMFTGATGHGNVSGEVQATATGFTGGWTMIGTINVPD